MEPFLRSKFSLPLGPHANRAEAEILGRYIDEDAPTKACNQCGATDIKLNLCSRCKRAWYCSPECQRAAWLNHKADCRKDGSFLQLLSGLIWDVIPRQKACNLLLELPKRNPLGPHRVASILCYLKQLVNVTIVE